MKTTLWITARANRDTRSHGYTVHVVDPSPGIDNGRRTLASDFGVPINVEIPDGWEVADVDGMPTMCMEGNPMSLQWSWKLGKIHAWPQFATFEDAQRRGAVHEIEAPKLADIP